MARLINVGDTWSYFKGTVEPPSDWADISFDDSSWLIGPSGFGYGDGDDNTVLLDMEDNYISVFIRKEFNVDDATKVIKLTFDIVRDDGFVAYINGVEAIRRTMPGGTINYDTAASGNHEADHTDIYSLNASIPDLVTGTNVLAVQGHNVTLDSSDFSLAPGLEIGTGVPNKILTRQRRIVKPRPRRANKGIFVVGDLFSPIPIMLDKWQHIKSKREKRRKCSSRKGHFAFVNISTPSDENITVDKWLPVNNRRFRRRPQHKQPLHTTEFIEVIQEVNGNYFDTGTITFSFDLIHEESQIYADAGNIEFNITVTSDEDFQLEDTGTIDFTIEFPETGVETFNSGVPGFVQATVIIDGINQSEFIEGIVSVIRSDNSAARFSLSFTPDPNLIPPIKPATLINKTVVIRFSVADMDGVIASYIPVFIGICKRVEFNEDIQSLRLSGIDYGGVHQTKGEFISSNITEILTGSVYANKAETISTGKSPIWGVEWLGNFSVEDGVDFFVDTLSGEIVIPISSRVLQFPNSFTYNYANPFNSMKDIIQTIVGKKGWKLKEDNVVIEDYSSKKEQPVLSLSDESIIDMCRKFLELSGAKVEGNLFPKLRVYSEVKNFATPSNTIIMDESDIFENSLDFSINIDNLLTEQTVQSVQKVNASISISNSEALVQFEGQRGSVNPFALQGGSNVNDIDYQTPAVLATHRIRKRGIHSLSFSTSGTFSLFFGYNNFSESIQPGDWSWRTEGDDFVFELKHRVVTAGGAGGSSGPFGAGGANFLGSSSTLIAFPAIDYTLTVNGTRIKYGEGITEDLKIVKGTRPVTGLSETLKGDVYENPFIETARHAGNIANAILNEAGNVYSAKFEIPIFKGKDANIGDNLKINRDGEAIFTGIIKTLGYSINTANGENVLVVNSKGVGIGI